MRWRQMFGLTSLLCLSLLVLAPSPCGSELLVYNTGQQPATTRFDDVPAAEGFGPRVPEEGFAGRLQVAKPDIYACSQIDGPAKAPSSTATPTATATTGGSRPTPTDSTLRPATTRAHAGGIAGGSRVWGRLDTDSSTSTPVSMSRYERYQHGSEVLDAVSASAEEAAGGGGEGEELPSAVLISRSPKDDPGDCSAEAMTFEYKVLNAQAAGFGMVVVFDSEQESLFKMGSSSDKRSHYLPVEIPVVLVSHASGLALMTLIAATSDPRGPEIYLDNADPFGMFVTVNLTMFMLVTGFLLALLTCGSMMVVTLHRYLRRYESLVAGTNRPMSLPEVLQLPEVCVEAGSRLEGDSCPVCLESYQLGDKLRSLPCQHAFHAGCITPWLTQRQRTCPMCKDPITLRPAPAPSSSTPSAVLSPPLAQGTPSAAVAGGGVGRGGGGGGGGDDAVGGDRLPLLSNSRGAASDGGSIQETSPV